MQTRLLLSGRPSAIPLLTNYFATASDASCNVWWIFMKLSCLALRIPPAGSPRIEKQQALALRQLRQFPAKKLRESEKDFFEPTLQRVLCFEAVHCKTHVKSMLGPILRLCWAMSGCILNRCLACARQTELNIGPLQSQGRGCPDNFKSVKTLHLFAKTGYTKLPKVCRLYKYNHNLKYNPDHSKSILELSWGHMTRVWQKNTLNPDAKLIPSKSQHCLLTH